MNSEQAKKLSLPDLLAALGHSPVKSLKGGYELWYISPFRPELAPSFHTSFLGGKWIWNDFGDTGGTVLDFIMRYYQTDVRGALAKLDTLAGSQQPTLFPHHTAAAAPAPAVPVPDHSETLVLRRASPLSQDSSHGQALLQYLTQSRGINAAIAMKYLVEVQFHNTQTGKIYFAAGLANEQGGYEIRNAYFKSAIGKKSISFLKGRREGAVAVFEGFMDFLSALTYYQAHDGTTFQDLVQADTLIMNSASFHERTKQILNAGRYTRILLYLDNDATGQRVKASLQAEFGARTEDGSSVYGDYKDFNLFLTSIKR